VPRATTLGEQRCRDARGCYDDDDDDGGGGVGLSTLRLTQHPGQRPETAPSPPRAPGGPSPAPHHHQAVGPEIRNLG
jgi:hypothetical protein